MDARPVLLSRIDALVQDLALAKKALGSSAIRPDLRERVGALFSSLLDRKTSELGALARQVSAPAAVGAAPLASHWTTFREHGDDCARIFREYLAFLEGALLRSSELDAGMCEIGDHFLQTIAADGDIPWPRFTIMAEGEFFAPLTEIIRLRYPHVSIWNLPVLAHEFGHFAASGIRDRLTGTRVFNDFRRQTRDDLNRRFGVRGGTREVEKRLRHLDEFFADVFAVYTVGPAFACTCVCLRFDPQRAHLDTDEHPGDADRAHVLFRTIENADTGYGKLGADLRQTWLGALAAVDGVLADPDRSWLDPMADALLALLSTHVAGARYGPSDWQKATGLGRRLHLPGWQDDAGALTTRDVLNGAWLCRLDYGEKHVTAISRRALDLCRGIVSRPASRP